MKQFHFTYLAAFGFALISCKPQVFKDAAVCYSIVNAGNLYAGDSLKIYNCSTGDLVYLAVERDSSLLNTDFRLLVPDARHIWALQVADTGTYYCRIQVAFKGVYTQVVNKDFEIKVKPRPN